MLNKKSFKTSLMAGAAIATVAGVSIAQAQEASVEKVTVTGTRIPQKGLKSVSPVSTITGNEAKVSGTTSVETLLNDLPQVNPTQGAEVSNGSSGTATVDLRGLGANRTLVLINGKRLHPANIAAPVADLNNIPVAMIDRVEVLTGGASAVYGADAVAGVVNFIFRKNFEGMEVGTSYQINDHDNDDAVMRNIVTSANFRAPEKHVNDGRIFTAWGVMGANSADGKGNMTAYIQYRNAEALLQSERDYSACALASDDAGSFFCLGSSNGPTGRFNAIDAGAGSGPRFTANAGSAGTMREYVGAVDTFNFNPTNFLQRPDDRYLLGFSGNYQIDDNVDFYTDVSFMDDRTVAQIAASGFFANSGPLGGNFLVNCDNPLLDTGATEGTTVVNGQTVGVFTPLNALCGSEAPVDLGTTGTATVNIGRRFVETNLGRQDDFQSTSYRLVGGMRGQIEDWDYDVYAQYGTTSTPRAYLNDVSRSRAQRALLVAIDNRIGSPTFGQPVCTSVLDGTDTSCIPANIFSFGQLTRDSIAYMSGTGIQKTTTEEQIVSASLNGDIGATSPWALDAIQMALGAEYRFNALKHISDDVFASGDLLGQGGATPNVNGHFDVWEAFGEIQIPIIQDQPFAKLVEFSGGYRISDYDLSGITHTYKYAGSWMPVDDVRLRGSFQHAVRSPNVIELFTPEFQGLWGGTDPCALTSSSSPGTNFYTVAQCQNTGLTPAQFALFTGPGGGSFQCPAAQCSGRFGGNFNLKPESSDTKSFGLVFTPTFLKGFNATIDYYDIEIEDQIIVISQTALIGDCAVNNTPFSCSFIHRDPVTGVLSNSTTLGVGVDSVVINSGTQNTRGIDVEMNYKFDLGGPEAGSVAVAFTGSYVDKSETNYGQGFESFDCVGFYGLVCGNPVPEWKHKVRWTWMSPFDVNFSVAWRHLAGVSLDANSGASSVFDFPAGGPLGDLTDAIIPAYDYFDLGLDWNVTDNVRLLGGINNVTDEDPPAIDSQFHGISSPPFGNANTYPVVYDSMGRQVFVSMTTRF